MKENLGRESSVVKLNIMEGEQPEPILGAKQKL